MTVSIHVYLSRDPTVRTKFGFHSNRPHAENDRVVVLSYDGRQRWEGVVLSTAKVIFSGYSYASVAEVAWVGQSMDPNADKRKVDGGDPVPVTVTIGDEPSNPIEPIVVILDP